MHDEAEASAVQGFVDARLGSMCLVEMPCVWYSLGCDKRPPFKGSESVLLQETSLEKQYACQTLGKNVNSYENVQLLPCRTSRFSSVAFITGYLAKMIISSAF